MSTKPSNWSIFSKGLMDENPIFRLALSLCPALAVTTSVINALAMGLSVMFVITMNNIVVSLFRHWVHPKVRVPVYIMSIATIVTVVELILEAYFPLLFQALGIYLALVVVFAIILARAEVFASKNKIFPSMLDGLGMGAGFLFAMLLIGVIRELSASIILFTPNTKVMSVVIFDLKEEGQFGAIAVLGLFMLLMTFVVVALMQSLLGRDVMGARSSSSAG